MSNLKKMLSVIMAVAMLMSVMVMGTGAAFTDQKDVKNTEAVDMNVALGIIKGYEDGSFKPTANVTRAEMAKMICFMLNGGKDPTLGTITTSTFTDAKGHWAAPYIEYCAASGIVAGIGGGLFAPDATVTATQAAKMLLVCMGYEAATEGYNGLSWAVKINVRANAKGLYNDVSVDPNAPLNRDNASQMVWNALNAGMNEYSVALGTDANGALQNIKTPKDKTRTITDKNGDTKTVVADMLWEKFKAETYVNTMVSTEWDKTDKEFDYSFESLDNKGNVVSGDFSSKKDYSNLFMMKTKVVYKVDNNNNKNVVYGMFAEDSKVLASGVIDDIAYVDQSTIKIDGTKYKLDTNLTSANNTDLKYKNDLVAYAENIGLTYTVAGGVATPSAGVKKSLGDTGVKLYYTVKAIDQNGNGKVDYFTYLPYGYAEVNSVSKTNVGMTNQSDNLKAHAPVAATTLKFDDDTIYDGIAKGDYVKVVMDANSIYSGDTVTKMDTFEGTVTGTKTNGIQVNSKWYTTDFTDTNASVNTDGKYNFYGVGSFVFYTGVLQAASIDNLLYVAETEGGMSKKAKVYFADGTSDNVSVKEVRNANGVEDTTAVFTNGASSTVDDQMYTFSKKGNEYVLTRIGADNKLGYKNFATATAANIGYAKDNAAGKLNMTAPTSISVAFADDAVVFIEKTDSSVKVVTGKVARDYKQNAGNAYAVNGSAATALYNEVTGVPTASVACITATSTIPSSKGESGNYGYITSDPYTKKVDGDTYTVFMLWNGTKESEVMISGNLTNNYKKNQVITYSDLGNGEIDTDARVLKGTDTLSNGKLNEGSKAAVSGISGKTLTLKSGANGATGFDFYLTNDTKYLYVNTSDKAKEETGSVSLADDGTATGTLIPNVMVYVDEATGSEIDLIVVDTGNELNLAS